MNVRKDHLSQTYFSFSRVGLALAVFLFCATAPGHAAAPTIEGMYQVRSEVPSHGSIQPDRMIVMDTLSAQGIAVSFVESASGKTLYTFSQVTAQEGTRMTLQGLSAEGSLLRSVNLTIDPAQGTASGSIRDSRADGDLRVSGQRALALGAAPSAPDDALCPEFLQNSAIQFSGKLGEAPGTLTIKRIEGARLGATFTSSTSIPYQADFIGTLSNPDKTIQLVHSNPDGNHLKISLRCEGKGKRLVGIGFGQAGAVSYETQFEVIQ